jgi:hypothetical protein
MVVNDNAGLLGKRGALESIASKLAPTGLFVVAITGLFLRFEIIQRPILRQLTQYDDLRNPKQCVAMRALHKPREVTGHDAGRGKGFAGVGQQGFGVDIGTMTNIGLGLHMVKLLDQWSRHRSLLNELGGGRTRASRPGIKEPGAPKCPTHGHQMTDRTDLKVTLASLEIYRAAKPDR